MFHRKFVHSQNGEDGIIEALLNCMEKHSYPLSRWAVEFGAHDGTTGSNTLALVEDRRFRLFYIEGDKTFESDLHKLAARHNGNIIVHMGLVTQSPGDLDTLFTHVCPSLPANFDVLSIDVDGPDYIIWKQLKLYAPKIVVIETHCVWPPGDKVYYEEGVAHGQRGGSTSLSAMLELAVEKGYVGVDYTGNLVCVRKDIYEKICSSEAPPTEADLFGFLNGASTQSF